MGTTFADSLGTNFVPKIIASQPLLTIGGFFCCWIIAGIPPCVSVTACSVALIAGKIFLSRRSILLVASYVVGSAVIYAIAGIIVAQLEVQIPYVGCKIGG